MKVAIISAVLAVVTLIASSPAMASRHSGRYEVLWTNPCPPSMFCRLVGSQLEPNYGQALRFAHMLDMLGFRTIIEAVRP